MDTLPSFGSKLQFDEFFNWLWASINSLIVLCIEYIIHAYDLSATTCCWGGGRLGRLPSGRIDCHLQAFDIALSCLLLILLVCHDLSHQGGKLHL